MEFLITEILEKKFTPITLTLTFLSQEDLDRFTTVIGHQHTWDLPEAHDLYQALTKLGGKTLEPQK